MGSWIVLDLGGNKAICSVDIAWYMGKERSYDFIISLSEDGIKFKDVYAGTSTGSTNFPERYSVIDSNSSLADQDTAATARYVRITVNGNTESDTDQNQWVAITETDVNGRTSIPDKNVGVLGENSESGGLHHIATEPDHIGEEANETTLAKHLSTTEYDQIKNCSTDLDKSPTSIEYLTYFNCGRVMTEQGINGSQTVREFTLVVEENKTIPVSDLGHTSNGWTFNGTIPGPTMRMTEGDLVRIKVINSENNAQAHSLHMHSVHSSDMDGVEGPGGTIAPGKSFTYEFEAQPYGVYPYHCHVNPIADHINRGLYGMMIIDPKEPRPQMTEFAMTMNAYDLDYDQEGPTMIRPVNATVEELEEEAERDNEIYTVNGKAFDYMYNPIEIQSGKPYRVYLVNMVEFDPINNFHLHGNVFNYITSGTDETADFKNDIVTLSQGDRGILEFQYDIPGRYMFHAHVTEFTDLGWMGFFDVK
ncbi:MAG: multicopper oxidase domain-containing protein [Thermoproteota archaeon]|nr:multicopper oxidase domain-containing protein [Thermoproteota archaeon]